MDGIINFRELAKDVKNRDGKIIKSGTVFRSGTPSRGSVSDINALKERSIRNIYDFRGVDEIAEFGPLQDEYFTTNMHDINAEADTSKLPPIDFATATLTNEDLIGLFKLFYGELLSTATKYKDVLKQILEQESEQFLFHCSAGKDRTGVFGIIFMSILDFDLESIKNEYLIIEPRSVEYNKNDFIKKNPGKYIEGNDAFFTVAAEYFDAYIESINKKYGSLDEFITNTLGVTSQMKQEFKDTYLV